MYDLPHNRGFHKKNHSGGNMINNRYSIVPIRGYNINIIA